MSSPLTIGIVGTGRAGSALARALAHRECHVGPLWSRSGRAVEVAAELPGSWVVSSPDEVAHTADLTLVAVPDRAIEPVCASIRWLPGSMVAHVSGGTPVAALTSAEDVGALVGGWHPLKSFAGDPSDCDLRGVVFGIEAQGRLADTLYDLTAALGGWYLNLRPADRALYHASAALASNGLVALLAVAASLWEQLGLRRDTGMHALLPLIDGTVQNLRKLGVPAALTGPIERGDTTTVERHLVSLAGGDDDVAPNLYRALGLSALRLAVEKGGLSGSEREALHALLTSNPSA